MSCRALRMTSILLVNIRHFLMAGSIQPSKLELGRLLRYTLDMTIPLLIPQTLPKYESPSKQSKQNMEVDRGFASCIYSPTIRMVIFAKLYS